jgi:nitric oxide synthase oxygenase domain/subunit
MSAIEPMPGAQHPVFRTNQAFLHDTARPAIDADRVAADWALMYRWLVEDDELATACGFAPEELTDAARRSRIGRLRREVGSRGRTFTVQPAEMEFWVRYAWINADRCSGRQHARQQMVVRHRPEVTTGADLLDAVVDHVEVAMSASLPPQTTVTVLGPPAPPGMLEPMFATEQLMRAAGYRAGDGRVSGDGGYVDLTSWVAELGEPLIEPVAGYPAGTFDTLPMIAVGRDGDIAIGTCPTPHRHLVDIPWPQHPDADDDEPSAPGFACWPAVPLQTNFALDIAGQRYCALFSGWYVDEEIVVNLLDPRRYDWADRVGAAIHSPEEAGRLRRTDRLGEYRLAQIEIATLRAVRRGFRAARRRLSRVGPSQEAFGRFTDQHLELHGCPAPNDPGWTANRTGSRYRSASHTIPHITQTQGARLVRHWLSYRSLWPGAPFDVVDIVVPE